MTTKPPNDPDPPVLAQLAKLSELFAATYTLARQAYDREHGTIISAPNGWAVAVAGEDGQLTYLAVLGFVASPDRVHQALTAQRYPLRFSALCDPSTGRHISTFDGKVHADGDTFVREMVALRKFMAEAGEVAGVAH